MDLREQLVHDQPEDCPYLPGRTARMPLRWQLRGLTGEEFDDALAQGDRRVGRMLYRTSCADCTACEAIRVPVERFKPSRSQRRIWRKNEDVKVTVGPASFSEAKLALYNRHKQERGLGRAGQQMTASGYGSWFLESCVQTVEMCFMLQDELVGVSIIDLGARDTSSVYHYFDPSHSDRSIGTYSAMVELAWALRRGGRYHYLGLYVQDCSRLSYKSSFAPNERRVDGRWQLG
jgi:arginyl-tRNA--protein-N-Asp/Glu arginylyltransferase